MTHTIILKALYSLNVIWIFALMALVMWKMWKRIQNSEEGD